MEEFHTPKISPVDWAGALSKMLWLAAPGLDLELQPLREALKEALREKQHLGRAKTGYWKIAMA